MVLFVAGALAAAVAGGGAYALTHDRADAVGSGQPVTPRHAVREAVTAVAPPISSGFIAQLASFHIRSNAEAEAARLRANGVQARVLQSRDYNELRRGFWVVYDGPFRTLAQARAAADASGVADAFGRPVTAVR